MLVSKYNGAFSHGCEGSKKNTLGGCMNTAQMVPSAQIIVSIIPIIGILMGGAILFFYLLWRHKQVSLLIKTNSYKPARVDLRIFSLLTGLLLSGTGFILSLLFFLLEGLSYSLLGGLIPCVLGLALIAFYFLYPKNIK